MTWRNPIRSVRLRITVLTTAVLAVGLLIAAIVLFAVLRNSLLDAQAGVRSATRRRARGARGEGTLAEPAPDE